MTDSEIVWVVWTDSTIPVERCVVGVHRRESAAIEQKDRLHKIAGGRYWVNIARSVLSK